MPRKKSSDAVLKHLRAFGLAYPGAHLKSPWPDHCDLAVNDKTFAYMSLEGEPLGISCKLPHSCDAALMLPFTKPTGYGLGRSGWVTADFSDGTEPPVELLEAWLDESYRAQAPKRLVKLLDAGGAASAEPAARPARKKAAAKKKSMGRSPRARQARKR